MHTYMYTYTYIFVRVRSSNAACTSDFFSARAVHVRACRATLLHLKSQSANSKPAPKPWRPPPEALVRLANNSHKVLYLATLHCKCDRALTFKNFFSHFFLPLLPGAHTRGTRAPAGEIP